MRARRFPAYHVHPPSTEREPRALSRSARALGGAHGARRAQRRSCIGKGAAEELPPNGVRNAGHRGPIPNKCGARARTPRAGHVACVARRVRRPPCPKRPLAAACGARSERAARAERGEENSKAQKHRNTPGARNRGPRAPRARRARTPRTPSPSRRAQRTSARPLVVREPPPDRGRSEGAARARSDFGAGWPARALQARLALSARYKRKEAPASSGAGGGLPLIGTLVEEAEVHNCDASYLAQRRFYGPLTCSHSCRLL